MNFSKELPFTCIEVFILLLSSQKACGSYGVKVPCAVSFPVRTDSISGVPSGNRECLLGAKSHCRFVLYIAEPTRVVSKPGSTKKCELASQPKGWDGEILLIIVYLIICCVTSDLNMGYQRGQDFKGIHIMCWILNRKQKQRSGYGVYIEQFPH